MTPKFLARLRRCLGRDVAQQRRVGGGDINQAFCLWFEDKTRAFVKLNAHAPPGMFTAEANGLNWLREARALPVPEVLAVLEAEQEGEEAALVLSWIEVSRPAPNFDERLGRGLAALHRCHPAHFGWSMSNTIGTLPQSNLTHPTWAEFYYAERLEPQFALAVKTGRLSSSLVPRMERLRPRLAELLLPVEPPARLHGDLWSGNLMVGPRGEPWLIDPSVAGGHREFDLAMMRLFGGFGERVFASYDEICPLAPGAGDRLALHQLYPLLVHTNLFGGSYAAQVRRVLERYGG